MNMNKMYNNIHEKKNKLKYMKVYLHNFKWGYYFKAVRQDDNEDFYVVLCDPPFGNPQNPSGSGVPSTPTFETLILSCIQRISSPLCDVVGIFI